LEDISARIRVQVRYLSVAGVDSPGAAAPFVASLAGQHCQAVVVSGSNETAAAATDASHFPDTRFLLIGRTATGGNVLPISYQQLGALRSAVASAVEHLVGS
jgi:hypothetical protein